MTQLLQHLNLAGAIFGLLATVTVVFAGVVALSKNVVHSALALVVSLAGVAGLYVLLAADFLAAVQVLVYVGGILVLILFAVMLTNRISDVNVSNLSLGRGLAIPLGVVLATLIGVTALSVPWDTSAPSGANPTTTRLGNAFLDTYLLPFELASVVLLAALVGAVVIARKDVKD
jgi:NADH-quinone oxidoreductase subunit J